MQGSPKGNCLQFDRPRAVYMWEPRGTTMCHLGVRDRTPLSRGSIGMRSHRQAGHWMKGEPGGQGTSLGQSGQAILGETRDKGSQMEGAVAFWEVQPSLSGHACDYRASSVCSTGCSPGGGQMESVASLHEQAESTSYLVCGRGL